MPQVEDLEEGIKYDQNTLYKILKGLIKMPSNKMFVLKDLFYNVYVCQCVSLTESGPYSREMLDTPGTGVMEDCELPHMCSGDSWLPTYLSSPKNMLSVRHLDHYIRNIRV